MRNRVEPSMNGRDFSSRRKRGPIVKSDDANPLNTESQESKPAKRPKVACVGCGCSITAPRWFCGYCAKERREGRMP